MDVKKTCELLALLTTFRNQVLTVRVAILCSEMVTFRVRDSNVFVGVSILSKLPATLPAVMVVAGLGSMVGAES